MLVLCVGEERDSVLHCASAGDPREPPTYLTCSTLIGNASQRTERALQLIRPTTNINMLLKSQLNF